jgi:integrase
MTPRNNKPDEPDATTRKKRRERNRKRFDEENVLRLPVKRRQYMVWDAGTNAVRGLGILVSPTGTRSYRVVYYFTGSPKPHSMHLGRVGEVTLDEARFRANEARTKSRKGIDPKGADSTRSADFKSAVEDYIRHHQIGKRGNATALECQRVLLKSCADWHHRPVATIRAQEIDKLLCSIRDGDGKGTKGRPYLANKLHSQLRTFFTWCANPTRVKVKTSPMIGIEKPFDKEQSRERFFNNNEITAIWRAAGVISGVEERFLKLLVLTGKRKGALAAMRWEHIDDTWFWKPPKSTSANKRLHPAPLSSFAQRVIGRRQTQGYVFPGPVEGTHFIDSNILRRMVRGESGIADFFPHALRHTVETRMAELRIAPHIRDLLFDHQSGRGAGAGYDHHAYGDEMREAIEVWSKYVEGLVSPEGSQALR